MMRASAAEKSATVPEYKSPSDDSVRQVKLEAIAINWRVYCTCVNSRGVMPGVIGTEASARELMRPAGVGLIVRVVPASRRQR